jgi:hypothetical protein
MMTDVISKELQLYMVLMIDECNWKVGGVNLNFSQFFILNSSLLFIMVAESSL